MSDEMVKKISEEISDQIAEDISNLNLESNSDDNFELDYAAACDPDGDEFLYSLLDDDFSDSFLSDSSDTERLKAARSVERATNTESGAPSSSSVASSENPTVRSLSSFHSALEDMSCSSVHSSDLSGIDAEISRMSTDQLRERLLELDLSTLGLRSVLERRLKNHHHIEKLTTLEKARRAIMQHRYLVALAPEATCTEGHADFSQEIIQFPGVVINVAEKSIVDGMFREYCKPIYNQKLSDYCTRLTCVTQKDVDNALRFPTVLSRFQRWLAAQGLESSGDFCIVTDGVWDVQHLLKRQCEMSDVDMPEWGYHWINLRKAFSDFYQTGRLSMSGMMAHLDMQLAGRPNCNVHDAHNIARICCQMLEDGCCLEVNEWLDRPEPGAPRLFVPSNTSSRKSAASDSHSTGAAGSSKTSLPSGYDSDSDTDTGI